MLRVRFALFRLVCVLAALPSTSFADRADSDPRLTAIDAPARWQSAVIKLSVPVSKTTDGRRSHRLEQCTGTIVDTKPRRIISAWHCFDGYDDLTRPPQFRVGETWYRARLLSTGGSMQSDWAVLVAEAPIIDQLSALPVAASPTMDGAAITMAGFSGDAGLGANGEILTFDATCTVSHRDSHWVYSKCAAHQGASGGPVLANSDGVPKLAGVISGRDQAGNVLFVPIHRVPLPYTE